MTEQRKLELEKKAERKEMKRVKRVKEGECGLIGRRRRARMGKEVEGSVRYDYSYLYLWVAAHSVHL